MIPKNYYEITRGKHKTSADPLLPEKFSFNQLKNASVNQLIIYNNPLLRNEEELLNITINDNSNDNEDISFVENDDDVDEDNSEKADSISESSESEQYLPDTPRIIKTKFPPDYIIEPEIADETKVRDLNITRTDIGGVMWPGYTNIKNLNLVDIINIDRDSNGTPFVEVYPKTEGKPPINSGLNKRAILTFYGIKPPSKMSIKDFEKKLQKKCKEMDAIHKSYEFDGSQWIIEVKHFTRYGLDEVIDSSDEKVRNFII